MAPMSSLTSRDTRPPGLVQQKRTLVIDSVMVFQLFYFYGHFSHFWALGGPLGVTRNSGGPPRAPMSSLTSRDTLPPGLVPKKRTLIIDSVFVFSIFLL